MKSLAAGMAFLLFVALSAPARTITVGPPPSDFPLIGPAVAAALEGDIVLVRGGVYREDLTLARRIVLRGEGRPTLVGTGMGTIIDVQASGCEIRGFDISGSGTGQTNLMDAGLHLASSGNIVAGNRFQRVFYGIVVEGSSHNEISGNDLTGLQELRFGRRGDGLYLYRSTDNVLAGNRIRGMKDGIYVQFSPRCRILRNRIERCRYGLHDMYSNDEEVAGNSFAGSSVGANVMNCHGVRLIGNRFESNRGVTSVGLSLKECDRAKIENNELVDNVRGLQIEGSSGNRFVGNRFRYNDTAIELFASAEENVFTRNDFDGNLTPVVLSGGSSSTRWSEYGAGNFWSGYEGFDFDGKGVGREPHPVSSAFERIEGSNPAARLFLASPAASALNFASRGVLPESEGAIDRFPLVRPASVPTRRLSGKAMIFAAAAILGAAAWRRKSR